MISIVTICFNNEHELARTIQSVSKLKAITEEVELVVVDGSVSSRIRELVEKEKVVDRFISERDGGIADAWNKGIRVVSGSHVVIVNSGDEILPEAYVKAIPLLKDDSVLFTSIYICDEFGEALSLYVPRPRLLFLGMYVGHAGAFVPKSFYASYGDYFNLKFSMDYEWFRRNLARINYFSEPSLVTARFYLGGVSSKYTIRGFWSDFKVQKSHTSVFIWVFLFIWFLVRSAKFYVRRRLDD